MPNGKIIINPFGIPGQNLHQAKRLQSEFKLIGVDVEILYQAHLSALIKENQVKTTIGDTDFIIYLDKDKYLSSMLEKSGYKLFNSHEAIRVCDDKGETYIALANNGFNLPKTIFAPVCYRKECQISNEYIETLENEIGYPIILKTSYGSCGSGVFLAQDKTQLLSYLDDLKLTPYMCQEYLGVEKGKDIRVIVIGGKAVAGMERYNKNDFRSNIALGGKGEQIDLESKDNKDIKDLAEKVAKCLNLDYCGVDILYGNGGEKYVCEVNSNAFFEGIESVTKINVAKIYAEYILEKVKK